MTMLASQIAIYARVSSHRQQQQATIESQIAEVRSRVAHDGFAVQDDFVFVDDGHSGAWLDRPGLDRLRDLCRDGVIRRVYVHSPDRLARRFAHQSILLDELGRAGCEVVFLNQSVSPDPESQLLIQIQGVIAEYERAKIAERLRRGKLHRARQGGILSWKAPYGYRYVPRQGATGGSWEIDEPTAEMVRAMFSWVAGEELSIRAVTRRLNASSWRPRGGNARWSPSSVGAILTNEVYIGISYYNRRRWIESDRTDPSIRKNRKTKSVLRPREEWITIPVPPLIDAATFRRAQEQMKTNHAFARRNLRRAGEYLLRGLASCGVCDRSLLAHSRGKHTYYHCTGGVDPVAAQITRRCPAPMVYAPDLDDLVWEKISEFLASPERLEEAFEQQRGTAMFRSADVVDAELDRLEARISDAERQVKRLLDAYQLGLVQQEELASRRATLERTIGGWRDEGRRLEAERPRWREAQQVSQSLDSFALHAGSGLRLLDFDAKQKLLRKLVERVLVTAGQVQVKLKIPLSTNSDLTPVRVHHPEDPPRVLPA